MKVGIAGYGFVGQAHEYILSDDLSLITTSKNYNNKIRK